MSVSSVSAVDFDVAGRADMKTCLSGLLLAASLCHVDASTWLVTRLVTRLRTLCHRFPALVTAGFYLPAPPVYCPQPTPAPQVWVTPSPPLPPPYTRPSSAPSPPPPHRYGSPPYSPLPHIRHSQSTAPSPPPPHRYGSPPTHPSPTPGIPSLLPPAHPHPTGMDHPGLSISQSFNLSII